MKFKTILYEPQQEQKFTWVVRHSENHSVVAVFVSKFDATEYAVDISGKEYGPFEVVEIEEVKND